MKNNDTNTFQLNSSLKEFNSFGLEVFAEKFILLHTIENLQQLIHNGMLNGQQLLILGGGSNLLFTKDFNGLVLKNELEGISILEEDANTCLVRAASGEAWHKLVMFCVEKNFGGIENLSLIPGTVGAAPIQNIGAYGVELKNVFEELEAINLQTGERKTFTKEECRFGYRDSIFKQELKNKYFIASVTIQLKKQPEFHISYGAIQQTLEKNGVTQLSVKAISDAVIEIRKSKLPDPAVIGNAGSFFKNPEIDAAHYEELKKDYPALPGYPSKEKVKVPAGWLIEQCGWKGKRVGNTGAHKDQALVLVNYGGATGKEVFELAMQIQKSVKEKFKIEITPEVNIL